MSFGKNFPDVRQRDIHAGLKIGYQVCRMNKLRSALWICLNGRDGIQAQQGEVRQIITTQPFRAKMSMNAAKSSKSALTGTNSFEIRQFDLRSITDDDIFHVAFSIDENPYLSPDFG